MTIAAVGTALPTNHYDQRTLTDFLTGLFDDAASARLRRLHENTLVAGRHLALPLEAYADLTDFTRCNDAWIGCATDLGERAIGDALGGAGLSPQDVDAIFVTTVTGVASPSLDARLVNRMGLRRDVRRLPLFGLGCVGGAAAVSRAHEWLRGQPDAVAVVLAVELCSLTLQREDRSVANLIATGLFGDGAAAAVLVGAERLPANGRAAGPRIAATRSVFYPDTEDVMGWHVGAHGFRIVLSPSVPSIARERLPGDVDDFLRDLGLTRGDIGSWVCHPGGPKVLEALEQGLLLRDDALALSWRSLEQRGNLSSASVLMILADTMQHARPAVGTHGVMLAMGPGFCSELLHLAW